MSARAQRARGTGLQTSQSGRPPEESTQSTGPMDVRSTSVDRKEERRLQKLILLLHILGDWVYLGASYSIRYFGIFSTTFCSVCPRISYRVRCIP
eukprot:scaffold3054_cov129-Cylindrotheca_fusiformis.AAC.2